MASKLKKVSKSEIVNEKKYPNYGEYKNRVIKQLKHWFDSKKSGYLHDDEEYKGIRDEDYYKPERVKNAFEGNNRDYNYRVYESRGSQYYESYEEYLSKIKPYLENGKCN